MLHISNDCLEKFQKSNAANKWDEQKSILIAWMRGSRSNHFSHPFSCVFLQPAIPRIPWHFRTRFRSDCCSGAMSLLNEKLLSFGNDPLMRHPLLSSPCAPSKIELFVPILQHFHLMIPFKMKNN